MRRLHGMDAILSLFSSVFRRCWICKRLHSLNSVLKRGDVRDKLLEQAPAIGGVETYSTRLFHQSDVLHQLASAVETELTLHSGVLFPHLGCHAGEPPGIAWRPAAPGLAAGIGQSKAFVEAPPCEAFKIRERQDACSPLTVTASPAPHALQHGPLLRVHTLIASGSQRLQCQQGPSRGPDSLN